MLRAKLHAMLHSVSGPLSVLKIPIVFVDGMSILRVLLTLMFSISYIIFTILDFLHII